MIVLETETVSETTKSTKRPNFDVISSGGTTIVASKFLINFTLWTSQTAKAIITFNRKEILFYFFKEGISVGYLQTLLQKWVLMAVLTVVVGKL